MLRHQIATGRIMNIITSVYSEELWKQTVLNKPKVGEDLLIRFNKNFELAIQRNLLKSG